MTKIYFLSRLSDGQIVDGVFGEFNTIMSRSFADEKKRFAEKKNELREILAKSFDIFLNSHFVN